MTDYSANSFSTATNTVIDGFSQHGTLEDSGVFDQFLCFIAHKTLETLRNIFGY